MICKKKGHRTITILITFHRLLMKTDRSRLLDFEKCYAFHNDTSQIGESMPDSAMQIATLAEVSIAEGKEVVEIL